MDNRVRRMESRLADFRILCNDVKLHKNRLEAGDGAMPASRLESIIKEKEEEVLKERAAIISDLQNMTATFVEGANREYVSLRKFFLLYLYNTIRMAHEKLSDDEFQKLLTENPEGVSFEVPNRGTVTFPLQLSKKIAMAGKMLFVNTAGVETSTIAIALAILQAPQLKHCSYPNCKREDCIAVKSDYEQLFEIFFKEKARTLGFQKARGEMSAAYDVVLSLPTKESMKEPEPEPVSL